MPEALLADSPPCCVAACVRRVSEQSGKVRLVESVQQASDAQAALTSIRNEIEPELQELLAVTTRAFRSQQTQALQQDAACT